MPITQWAPSQLWIPLLPSVWVLHHSEWEPRHKNESGVYVWRPKTVWRTRGGDKCGYACHPLGIEARDDDAFSTISMAWYHSYTGLELCHSQGNPRDEIESVLGLEQAFNISHLQTSNKGFLRTCSPLRDCKTILTRSNHDFSSLLLIKGTGQVEQDLWKGLRLIRTSWF
jgi:hypothetical protein